MHLRVHLHAWARVVHMHVYVGAHMRSRARRHMCEHCMCEQTYPWAWASITWPLPWAWASITAGSASKSSKAWNFWNSSGVGARLGRCLAFSVPLSSHRVWPPTGQGLRSTDRPAWYRHFPNLLAVRSWGQSWTLNHLSAQVLSKMCSVFISMLTF